MLILLNVLVLTGVGYLNINTSSNQIIIKIIQLPDLSGLESRLACWQRNLHLLSLQIHYTLHLPEMGRIDRWGIWLLGVVVRDFLDAGLFCRRLSHFTYPICVSNSCLKQLINR